MGAKKFMGLISWHSICQMHMFVNFSGHIDFLRTVSKFMQQQERKYVQNSIEACAKLLFCLSKPIAFLLFSLMSLQSLLKLPTLYLMPGGINYTKTTITASYTPVHVVAGIHSQVKPEFPLSIMKNN